MSRRLPAGGWRLGAVLIAGLLAGCAGDEQPGGSAAQSKQNRPCSDLLKPAAPDATPPADVPLAGVTWFDKKTQGRTAYHFGTIGGDDVATVRDAVLAPLTAAGYTVVDTDQEGGAEADAQFTGPHEGSLQVTPHCKGHVQLRLRLAS